MGKIRVRDIADSLGISPSTVSRALNGNAKISEKSRAAILEKTRELGYTPTSTARLCQRTDPIHIAVLCPFDIYFETVVAGMKAALSEMDIDNVVVEYRFFDVMDVTEQTKQLREIVIDDSFQGVAIAPAHPTMLNPLIDEFSQKGKMAVTFNTDAPRSGRSHFVGQHALAASGLAAQLCGSQLRQGEEIAVINSFAPAMALKERLDGFFDFIHENYPYLRIIEPIQFNDTIDAAEGIAEQVILMNKGIKAIYSNNMVGTIGCARAVEKTGNNGQIFVVGYDDNEEIERYIREGIIFATVLQEPFHQGFQAIKILLNWLVYGKKTKQQYFFMKNDLMMKSTLEVLRLSGQSKAALAT